MRLPVAETILDLQASCDARRRPNTGCSTRSLFAVPDLLRPARLADSLPFSIDRHGPLVRLRDTRSGETSPPSAFARCASADRSGRISALPGICLMKRWLFALVAALGVDQITLAQGVGTLIVSVRSQDGPVAQAEVQAGPVTRMTGANGNVIISLPPGPIDVVVPRTGSTQAPRKWRFAPGWNPEWMSPWSRNPSSKRTSLSPRRGRSSASMTCPSASRSSRTKKCRRRLRWHQETSRCCSATPTACASRQRHRRLAERVSGSRV